MNFTTFIIFVFTGATTFFASRIIRHFGGGDDVAQLVYPIIALFFLWISSFVESKERKKEVSNARKTEREIWVSLLKNFKRSKDELYERIIQAYTSERKYNDSFYANKIDEAIKNELPYKKQVTQLSAKLLAISSRNAELVEESSQKDEHIEAILISKSSLDRKISDFIRQLRLFHQEINRELKDTTSKNSSIWKTIDELAGKIFEEINRFDAYISQSLIEEKEQLSPINRKTTRLEPQKEFDSQVDIFQMEISNNRKR
ncbi:hypothetical protein [Raoultella sp. C349492]|uniref:hypothetical protein n=1 Tax=Raoultella sp. C349492 TaxID=2970253 RepID=UPI0035C6E2BA